MRGFCFRPGGFASINSTMKTLRCWLLTLMCALTGASAWDYEGHRLVNQVALASLPTNFPSFVRTPAAAERIAFLGGEADRWRNTPDLALKHCNGPDHYIDLEEIFQHGLKLETTPALRYDFISLIATNRVAQPDKVPFVDVSKDTDHTRALVGLLPWTLAEYQGKLKSGFSYLKAYELHGGTGEEIANAQANIIYIMGVMGHFAGDAAQPLHTTVHHAGWVGDNPNGYSTNRSIHQWIDGGYLNRVGIPDVAEMKPRLRPAQPLTLDGRPARADEGFMVSMRFIEQNWKLVEPLYRLDQEGGLSARGENGMKGREFLAERLLAGGQFLGDLWLTAWQQAPEDKYLIARLKERAKAATPAAK